jgi:hypothetical protein
MTRRKKPEGVRLDIYVPPEVDAWIMQVTKAGNHAGKRAAVVSLLTALYEDDKAAEAQ